MHYVKNNQTRAGVMKDGAIYDIALGAKKAGIAKLSSASSIDWILTNGLLGRTARAAGKIMKESRAFPMQSVKLRSPVLSPQKILMVAVNYASHGKETKVTPPSSPYVFTKFNNTLIGPDDPILLPRISKMVDWEVELAVIIGKKGKYITKKDAYEYVAGYSVSNDVSFRDFQLPPGWPEKQNPLGLNWLKGKGMDSSFPLGPWIATSDEVRDPHGLRISLAVNGQVKQDSSTSEMIFKIDELIEYVSDGITLLPGDIISTGTPFGVAHGSGQSYLKDGDIVECKIEKIGTLRNPVIGER